MGVYDVFNEAGEHLGRMPALPDHPPEGAIAVELGAGDHGSFKVVAGAWERIDEKEFWERLRRTGPASLVAQHPSVNGVLTRTVLRGGRYISETLYEGVVISRAENNDPFHAGCAHMAFHMSWSQATESNLKQAALEARGQ